MADTNHIDVHLSDETRQFIQARFPGGIESGRIAEALKDFSSSVFYDESRYPTTPLSIQGIDSA